MMDFKQEPYGIRKDIRQRKLKNAGVFAAITLMAMGLIGSAGAFAYIVDDTYRSQHELRGSSINDMVSDCKAHSGVLVPLGEDKATWMCLHEDAIIFARKLGNLTDVTAPDR